MPSAHRELQYRYRRTLQYDGRTVYSTDGFLIFLAPSRTQSLTTHNRHTHRSLMPNHHRLGNTMLPSITLFILVSSTFGFGCVAYQPASHFNRQFSSRLACSDKDSLPYLRPAGPNHRRAVLQSLGGVAGVLLNNPAQALEQTSIEDCLLDLPPKPPNTVRLYLCRHGQTENNRLHIVQGSRVDPPLNENGIIMAERLGLALRQIQPMSQIYHSPLLRAKQTAQVAASKLTTPPQVQVLEALAEMDFGPLADGFKEPRPNSVQIYSQWSAGYIDERPPGGESCREVLERCSSALSTLATTAPNNGHVVAVAHSAYLRMMLALVQDDLPLAKVVAQSQANANVNVLDIDVKATMTRNAKSSLFGGPFLSQAPKDFSLIIPKTNVVRINEIRHLEGVRTT